MSFDTYVNIHLHCTEKKKKLKRDMCILVKLLRKRYIEVPSDHHIELTIHDFKVTYLLELTLWIFFLRQNIENLGL